MSQRDCFRSVFSHAHLGLLYGMDFNEWIETVEIVLSQAAIMRLAIDVVNVNTLVSTA